MPTKEITVTTQEELDSLETSFIERTIIHIRSVQSITLHTARKNSYVIAWGNSSVVARKNNYVVARDNSTVIARENSNVEAWGNSYVEVWENSRVEARENSVVTARENSIVDAWGNSRVEATENSSVVALENSSIVAWGSSNVEAWGSSSILAWGNSSVIAWGSSNVVAQENSRVEAWENSSIVARKNSSIIARGNSRVVARENSHVEAWECAVVICIDHLAFEASIQKHGSESHIVVTRTWTHTVQSFLELYPKNLQADGRVLLYKSTTENLMDFYSNSIKYEGIVECPDWDPDPERECGGGLHLSPTKELALQYHRGTVLKCLVAKEDIVVFWRNIRKVRCRKVEVIGEA